MTIHANLEPCERLRQGDIYENVEFLEYAQSDGTKFEISKIVYPFVVVMTQDCDLEQDNRRRLESTADEDKILISAIVVPAYNAEHFFIGGHLSELNMKMHKKSRKERKMIEQNQNQRYHYLEFDHSAKLPSLVVDFKHYFTCTVNYLMDVKENKFLCAINVPYRESLSQRFAFFLSRIGLPSEPAMIIGSI